MLAELNELEKARILFHWITAQRFDAKDAPEHKASDFEVDSLKRWFYLIRTKKETYASLFNKLCNHCGHQGSALCRTSSCREMICPTLKKITNFISKSQNADPCADSSHELRVAMSKAMGIIHSIRLTRIMALSS